MVPVCLRINVNFGGIFSRHPRGSKVPVCGQLEQPGESFILPQWLYLHLQLLQGKHPSPLTQGQQEEVSLQSGRNGEDEDE